MTWRERSRLLIGLALSLLVHALVLTPLLLQTLRAAPTWSASKAAHLDAEDPPPPLTPLGLEQGPSSTLTWVGYETYQEHLAARAEFEQAAFTRQPTPPPSPAVPDAAPEVTPAPPEATTPAPEPAVSVLPITDLLPLGHVMIRLPTPTPRSTSTPDAKPVPTPPTAPPAPPTPVPSPPAPETPPEVGEPSDRESDPTSTIDVPLEDIRLGRPLAREGLELKPQRPKFTTLTLLTAAPCNPLVEIDFRANGRPAKARILETSCDERIDHAIESSLYRWRATGQQLDAIAENDVLTVRLRIVLGRRR